MASAKAEFVKRPCHARRKEFVKQQAETRTLATRHRDRRLCRDRVGVFVLQGPRYEQGVKVVVLGYVFHVFTDRF
jgi:hypothetical protein